MMTFAFNKSILTTCILALSSSMVVSADEGNCTSIADLACETEGLSTLCTLISVSESTYDFLSTETMTVFAPTDDAFAALDGDLLDSLGNCVPALNNVLSFHVVLDEVYSTDLVCGAEVPMANGVDSRTVCQDDQFYQKGALNPRDNMPLIVSADIIACNGVVHVVDEVMLPNLNRIPFGDCEDATSLNDPIEATGTAAPEEDAVEVVAPVENVVQFSGTASPADEEDASSSEDAVEVVAPVENVVQFTGTAAPDEEDASASEDAMLTIVATAPGNVLCPGQPSADYCDCEGDCLMHAEFCGCDEAQACCDQFTGTLPPSYDATASDNATASDSCQNIAEIACGIYDFSTLCDLVIEYELDDALSGGLWTVFAPTNEAFASTLAIAGNVTDSELETIVLFHTVVDQALTSNDLPCKELVEMASGATSRTKCARDASGESIKIQKGPGQFDGMLPQIVMADIVACNGIVHAVNNVMLPNL